MTLQTSEDGDCETEWSKIEPKAQISAQGPSASSNTEPTFTRSVELGTRFQQATSIWQWFETATNCTAVTASPEENAQMDQLNEFLARADVDRQRVKAGRDAERKQREELKKAREAAARMTNEE